MDLGNDPEPDYDTLRAAQLGTVVLEGTKGGPKEWGSQVTTGLVSFFILDSLHVQTLMLTDVQTPLPWDPLSSLKVVPPGSLRP